ncbi:MAG: hypothetical protein ACO36E_05000 [Synechocystis sp.]
MALISGLRRFNLLTVGLILGSQGVFAMVTPAQATALTKTQIETASQILCQALEEGQSPEAAKDAATAYLIEQVDDKQPLSPNAIRRQMRPAVAKQCPDQARKLKNL